MARLLFEEQGIRTRRGRLATGVEFVVYSDAAGTVLADISATSGGSSIVSSTVTTSDIAGLGPAAFRFYGPDGVDTLFLRCPGDVSLGVQEIEADTDERLDAVEAGGGGGGGGVHPDLATHDALGLATDAELAVHVAAADPHPGYALESDHTLASHDVLGLATDAELAAHAAAGDPHAGYALESDHTLAAHDALGLATDTELSAHEAAGDPHQGYATDTDLAAHEADTTGIHGIADASVLATDADLATHAGASDPHGDRAYADAVAQGLDPKASVRVKTTANLTLSGEQTIDGVLTSAVRVLVANQSTAAENGIYVSAAGAWARSTDADTSGEVTTGLYTFVEEGTTQASSGWVLTTPAPITLGTTPLAFTQFSQTGQILGGAGLLKTGNTLDVGAGTGLTVVADTVGITPGGVSGTELAASAVTNAKVDPAAAIAESKLALSFPTHAESHAARHTAAGADPLTGYVLDAAHTLAAHDTLGLVTDAILAAHEADTTVVHGITDTSALATTSGVTAAISTHAGLADPHAGYVLESSNVEVVVVPGRDGVVGDGTTNDLTAIAAKITEAQTTGKRRRVLLTGGSSVSYFVSGTLTVPSGVTLVSDGAKVVGDQVNGLVQLSGDGAQIVGVAVSNGHTAAGCIDINIAPNAVNWLVERCKLTGTRSQGVSLNATGIAHGRINQSTFDGNAYGVLTNSSANDLRDLRITDNTFVNIGGDAIELNHPGTAYVGARNVVIAGNYIETPAATGSTAGFGVGIAGATHVTIEHNHFGPCHLQGVHVEDEAAHIAVVGNTFETGTIGIYALDGDYLTVADNQVDGGTIGIQFTYDPTNWATHWSVHDNTVRGCSGNGIDVKADKQIDGALHDNIVSGCGGDGIVVAGTFGGLAGNLSVRGNNSSGNTGWGMTLLSKQGLLLGQNILNGNTAGNFRRSGATAYQALVLRDPSGSDATGQTTSGGVTPWVDAFTLGDACKGLLVVSASQTLNRTLFQSKLIEIAWDGTTLEQTLIRTVASGTSSVGIQQSGGKLQIRGTDATDGRVLALDAQLHGVVMVA